MRVFDNFDKYENFDELMADINLGVDIEFDYKGRRFYMGKWNGKYLASETQFESEDAEYAGIDEMLDKFRIDEKRLEDVYQDFEVFAH